MKLQVQIGQQYVQVGNRLFAIRKPMGLAERIAACSKPRGGWHKDNRVGGRARVIVNAR